MPTPPIDAHLNLVSQTVMNWTSYALTVVLLLWTVRMGRRERTPFYTLVVLASMVAAFGEPLYDEMFDLRFYTANPHGHIVSLFSAFNVPQPIWAYSGYALLYGLPAVFMGQKMRNGTLTARGLYAWACVEVALSCTFEIIGINIGTYSYWGPHVFRIAHYPIVIPLLEMAQVMCFSVAAAQLRHRAGNWRQLFGVFPIFPVTMYGANFGAGVAVILALHAQGGSKALIYICTCISIASAIALVRMAAGLIPPASTTPRADVDIPDQREVRRPSLVG